MSGKKSKATRKDVIRAARMYRTNSEAIKALKMSTKRFKGLCKQYKVETPRERREREKGRRRYLS